MIIMINRILWCVVAAVIILSSIVLNYYFDFAPLNMKKMFACFHHEKQSKEGISPFKTLMLTLAGRIGVGSIAGVSLAIYIGGPGTIFWLWFITILSLPLAFSETILGSLYKRKYGNEYVGGPSYYIRDGLGKPKLAYLYAILIILSFIGGFLGIQVNTITKSITEFLTVPNFVVGLVIAILTFLIIIGDVFKIANITSKMVPGMVFLYLGLCLYVLISNYDQIGTMFLTIIKSAFHLKPFFSGFLYTMIIGIQRGIFSNESGLGTGSITASASNSLDPVKDGYIQVIGVYVTSIIVCSITAFIVLLTPYQNLLLEDANGIEIASFAFRYHFGNWGTFLMFAFIFLCSFSTILTGYYDSLTSCRFLFTRFHRYQKYLLIFVTMIMLFLGAIVSSSIMWRVVDLFVAFLVLINVYTIFHLKSDILKVIHSHK